MEVALCLLALFHSSLADQGWSIFQFKSERAKIGTSKGRLSAPLFSVEMPGGADQYCLQWGSLVDGRFNQDRLTLLFVGDISFSGPVKYYVEHHFHSYNDSFAEVAPYIREADIAVGNLESPFISEDVYQYKYKGNKSVILDASPQSVSALRYAGFDAVTVANNHFNDFGDKGVTSSLRVLKDAGVKYFGVSYEGYDSSQEPLIMERKGIKIGFLGYCDFVSSNKNCTEIRMEFNSGPAIYKYDIAARDIWKLKAKVDIIVVLLHWGQEFLSKPLPYQLSITKHLMSLGAHVIIGAHPHVLEPHCHYGNKVAAFSLGNFLFPPAHLPGGNKPNLYGRLGKKPSNTGIAIYEKFVLRNCEAVKNTQMFRVQITKSGVQQAEYFPARLRFDFSKKRLYPKPQTKGKWIRVCGDEDKQCQKCF